MTEFHSPEEVEQAYYAAFAQADIEAMMEVWAERDDIVCLHPVSKRYLRGRQAVMENWLGVFAREMDFKIELHAVHRQQSEGVAVHVSEERIYQAGDVDITGIINVTNVFVLTSSGWKMVAHHASHGERLSPEGVAVKAVSSKDLLH